TPFESLYPHFVTFCGTSPTTRLGLWRGLRTLFCLGVLPHSLLRNEARVLTSELRENLPLVSDKHHALARHLLLVGVEFLWRRRSDTAVIPDNVKVRTVRLRCKLEPKRAPGRKRIVVAARDTDLIDEGTVVSKGRLYANR